jgi:hypothetical protein
VSKKPVTGARTVWRLGFRVWVLGFSPGHRTCDQEPGRAISSGRGEDSAKSVTGRGRTLKPSSPEAKGLRGGGLFMAATGYWLRPRPRVMEYRS